MHIKDQVVLVTGGARGLGLAITQALLNELDGGLVKG